MTIQHTNRKIKSKIKTSLYIGDERMELYLGRVRTQFILTNKINKEKEIWILKNIYKQEKKLCTSKFH